MPNLCALPQAERRALVERAANLATAHFGDGFNCAESVLRGVAEVLGLPADDSLLMAATPFGGGIGRAGAVCGALSGGAIALGLAHGRTTPDPEQKEVAYGHARRLWERFVEQAGSESCRAINPLPFDHPAHKAACVRIVAAGARLAAQELLGL
jgi:C_GCAxxG_C_C family probable redox protein